LQIAPAYRRQGLKNLKFEIRIFDYLDLVFGIYLGFVIWNLVFGIGHLGPVI
jgi:hypothetical protein